MRPWPNSSEPLYYGVNLNNNCPSCGALYNVAAKDIGRRLKCKKCNTALTVTEAGLVVDDEDAPRGTDARALPDEADGDPVAKKKRPFSPGGNPLAAVGGIPTVLFAFGVFLVIVFTSFPIIGRAGTDRAAAYTERLKNDKELEVFELKPKGKKVSEFTDTEKKKIEDETPKIEAKYERLIERAGLEAKGTEVSNRRDVWMEQWGLMFGFLFVSFGCIGYLRTEQPLVMRIVAGTVLTFLLMIMLMKFSGCAAPR